LVIWSTLQTFLQHKELERPAWRDRLWLVVLYDLKGISSLWQQADEAKSDEPQAAASFIDKSFQIRFEVPSLVLSDWRGFFVNRLKEAFPDHDDSDRHEVYRVLAIGQAHGDRLPTIRELKLFVNQIGAIHRQWSGSDRTTDTFPLAHIAYYVQLRRKGEDIAKRLLADSPLVFPSKDFRDLLGEGIRESLAAMFFNVEVNVAQQLLFTDRIKNALTTASSEELKKIEGQIPKGFWEMFEQIVTSEWTGEEVVKIADAAWALQQSELLTRAAVPTVRSVMRMMCDQAAIVIKWAPMDEGKARGLSTLIKWKNDPVYGTTDLKRVQFIDTLLRSIVIGLRSDALSAESFDARTWLQQLNLVIAEIPRTMRESAFSGFSKSLAEEVQSGVVGMEAKEFEAILEVASELANDPSTHPSVNKTLKDLADEKQIARRLRRRSRRKRERRTCDRPERDGPCR